MATTNRPLVNPSGPRGNSSVPPQQTKSLLITVIRPPTSIITRSISSNNNNNRPLFIYRPQSRPAAPRLPILGGLVLHPSPPPPFITRQISAEKHEQQHGLVINRARPIQPQGQHQLRPPVKRGGVTTGVNHLLAAMSGSSSSSAAQKDPPPITTLKYNTRLANRLANLASTSQNTAAEQSNNALNNQSAATKPQLATTAARIRRFVVKKNIEIQSQHEQQKNNANIRANAASAADDDMAENFSTLNLNKEIQRNKKLESIKNNNTNPSNPPHPVIILADSPPVAASSTNSSGPKSNRPMGNYNAIPTPNDNIDYELIDLTTPSSAAVPLPWTNNIEDDAQNINDAEAAATPQQGADSTDTVPERGAKCRRLSFEEATTGDGFQLMGNVEDCNCQFCGTALNTNDGVMLYNCLHVFCIGCMKSTIEQQGIQGTKCPLNDGTEYGCQCCVMDNEIIALLTPDVYQEYLIQSLDNEEVENDNSNNNQNQNDGWAQIQRLILLRNWKMDEVMEQLQACDILVTTMVFECPICITDVEPGRGIILQDCLHMFCRDCIVEMIKHSDDPEIKCAFIDANYSCVNCLKPREIKALLPADVYEKHLERSVKLAENAMGANSYHCKTPDCPGWCEMDEQVLYFKCYVCKKRNCLACKVIHEGVSCADYKNRLVQNENDKLSEDALTQMVAKGEAMHCPKCKSVVQKATGCDYMVCTRCHTEICWATKGPRWGPRGRGDITGGCRCDLKNGRPCVPHCRNCH